MQPVLDMGTGVVAQCHYEHARTSSATAHTFQYTALKSPKNFSWFTTLSMQGSERQLVGPVWIASASGMLAVSHVTLFSYALACLFCCTACDQELTSHAQSYMIICDSLYLLAVL